jgi:hypothetical protein
MVGSVYWAVRDTQYKLGHLNFACMRKQPQPVPQRSRPLTCMRARCQQSVSMQCRRLAILSLKKTHAGWCSSMSHGSDYISTRACRSVGRVRVLPVVLHAEPNQNANQFKLIDGVTQLLSHAPNRVKGPRFRVMFRWTFVPT